MDRTKRQQEDNQDDSAPSLTNQMISITSKDRYFAGIPAQAVILEEIYRMTT